MLRLTIAALALCATSALAQPAAPEPEQVSRVAFDAALETARDLTTALIHARSASGACYTEVRRVNQELAKVQSSAAKPDAAPPAK